MRKFGRTNGEGACLVQSLDERTRKVLTIVQQLNSPAYTHEFTFAHLRRATAAVEGRSGHDVPLEQRIR